MRLFPLPFLLFAVLAILFAPSASTTKFKSKAAESNAAESNAAILRVSTLKVPISKTPLSALSALSALSDAAAGCIMASQGSRNTTKCSEQGGRCMVKPDGRYCIQHIEFSDMIIAGSWVAGGLMDCTDCSCKRVRGGPRDRTGKGGIIR